MNSVGSPEQGATRRFPNEKMLLSVIIVFSVILIDVIAGSFVIPRNYNVFRRAHYYYHHGLLPNRADTGAWLNSRYDVFTDSLGFRAGSAGPVALEPAKRRVLFIGDSFTEGIGIPYEDTFVGLIGKGLDAEVLNAGVVGYSPKLYYLKVRYLIEEVGLKFGELVVFIDISDILNELEYEDYTPAGEDPDVKVSSRVHAFLREYSATYYLLSNFLTEKKELERQKMLAGDYPCWGWEHPEIYNNRVEGAWTVDRDVFDKYGRKGLALAEQNMQKLADLCRSHSIRLSIAVYPWPTQIYFNDYDSIQVRAWRAFAERNHLPFINLFPVFMNGGRRVNFDDVYQRYFIPTDIHWNKAGHALVARAVIDALKGKEQ